MIQRITTTSGSTLMLANLQDAYRRLTNLQDQISSGKQIRRPSDNPAGAISALDYRQQLRQTDQFDRNSGDAKGWLSTADSTLMSAQDYLARARDLALQGVNGATDAKGKAAIATELRQIRDGMVQLSNSTYRKRAIFAGTTDVSAAYPASGATAYQYQGNTGAVMRTLASGVALQVNVPGETAFGTYVDTSGGADPYTGNVFQVLDKLATDIEAGNVTSAQSGLTAVDTAKSRIGGVQADLGAKEKRVDDIAARNGQQAIEVRQSLSGVEDVDIEKAFVDVATQQMAYQAALQVTAKVVQPSLLDFLR